MDAIHKIITWVLSPMGILFLGLAFGGLLRAFGTNAPTLRKLGAWVIALVLVVFWVLGCGITTRFIGAPLEGPEIEVEKIGGGGEKIDAIVLLGGGMGLHEQCGRAEMFGSADRVWLAAKLWKKLQVPMSVSGSGAEAEKMFLVDLGVSKDAFFESEAAKNTEDEARMVKGKLAKDHPRILLVTSAWHMPRAAMLFNRAGFEVVEAPTDYEMTYVRENSLTILDFFPGADAMARNSYALKEWVARACYAIKK